MTREPARRRWLLGIFGIEPPGWPQRRARLELLRRAMRSAGTLATVGLGALAVLEALLTVGLKIAAGILVGSVPAAIGAGLSSQEGTRLVIALVGMGAVFVTSDIVSIARVELGEWVSAKLDDDLRLDLMDRMLAPVGIGHTEDPDVQDEVARAGGLGLFTPGNAVKGMAGLLVPRLVSIGSFVIVAAFRWWLAVAMLFIALAFEAKARRLYMETARIVYRQTQDLRRSDYFRGLALGESPKELRLFGLLDWVETRFTGHWLESMADVWRERRGAARHVPFGALAILVADATALTLIGRAAVRGEISVGAVATLASAIVGIRAFISYGLNRTWTEYGVTAYLPLLDLDSKINRLDVSPSGTISPEGLPAREIKFEDVAFRYPGRSSDVYSRFDLTIPAGRSLAIVGVNGVGKTTLCKLLARCYEPTSGRITVDGTDLKDLDAERWQRQIAAIFQDFISFPLSLADNVAFGAVEREYDRAGLDRVAAQAGIADIVAGLPHGWDTVLRKDFEKGAELSGGELQRVALARALFSVDAGATLLVLDEPTASLDVRMEAQLFDRYLELTRGVTSILISHRFSTVRHADRICVLRDGAVAEQGTHADLLELGAYYAEMFTLQASRFAGDVEGAEQS